MRDNNLPAWPPRVAGSAVERFKAALQERVEQRRRRELAREFAATGRVTDEEAQIAADAVMYHRQRKGARA